MTTDRPKDKTVSHRFLASPAALAPAMLLALLATPARAQDEEAGGPIAVDAALTLVSDYRFRGYSLSDKEPAIQPELTVSHESGLYVFFWGSTLADNGGGDIETDLGIGYARTVGTVDFDVNATWYLYPGASGLAYVEILTSLTAPVGPASLGVTFGYAPAQTNIGDIDNLYYEVHGSLPIAGTPLTLNGNFGIEDGAFGDAKRDWSLGLSADVAGFELGAAYVDAARHGGDPLADPTVVLSIRKAF